MSPTLQTELRRMWDLYGSRNMRTFNSHDRLLALLGAGIRLLEDAYEEGDTDAYATCLASIFARWAACMAEFAPTAVEAMASKYGSNCVYCKRTPCACPKVGRPAEKRLELNPEALVWSLRDWQQHLHLLYGERNRERGMDVVLRRLFSEHSEALSGLLLIMLPMPSDRPVNWVMLTNEIRNELCDVLAWTLAAASVLGIDLMDAVENRYGNGCPTCKASPCQCNIHHHHGIKARTTIDP